ncbi:ATP-binding protein [Desulfitispora alkaliphila]|uniref:ATP-binding protein n=1 Tax=Desulfitispora alkaliphila TaxID=622674 RepID=UPI003D1A232C
MNHVAKEEVFRALAKRLDKNPVGAVMSETLMQILYRLYTEDEARIGSAFPPMPVPIEKIAKATQINLDHLKAHLENMANKGLVIDAERKGKNYYMLSPLVVGFFEYTFMRVNKDLPMKELAELFEAYHHEEGVAEEFFGAETKMFQALGYEKVMEEDVKTEVLTYEKASQIIRDSGGGALTMCYCRHQMAHLGKNCDAPLEDVCTSLGNAAKWLIKRGFARPATTDELLRVLDRTAELGLMHLADNVQENPAYICHCCGCCCGLLRSINEHQVTSVHASNFIPKVNEDTCTACGICEESCHIAAIKVNETANVDEERCLGCGVCVSKCPQQAMIFMRKDITRVPPLNKKEQMMRIAKEKRKI